MNKDTEVRGDLLRKAIFVVWLANKFDKFISVAELARIAGYSSSGIYSAQEMGWFNINGNVILKPKAELYLEKNILFYHKAIKQIMISFLIFTILMILQRYAYDRYNIILMGSSLLLYTSATILIFLYIFWYRLLWLISRNRT